ncbi:MAG: hypothetical protein Q4G61_08660 [Tissierellia bacterium]|nr:hypothetical protein [Tissierellia bacterium]
MYIDRQQSKLQQSKARKRVRIYFGLMAFMIVVVILSLTDDDLRPHINVYAATALIFAALFGTSRLKQIRLQWYEHAAAIFDHSAYDQIVLRDFAASVAIADDKALRLLEKGLQDGILQNIILNKDSDRKIILRHKSSDDEQFDTWEQVKCPNCGASNTKKRGFVSVCEYCRSKY